MKVNLRVLQMCIELLGQVVEQASGDAETGSGGAICDQCGGVHYPHPPQRDELDAVLETIEGGQTDRVCMCECCAASSNWAQYMRPREEVEQDLQALLGPEAWQEHCRKSERDERLMAWLRKTRTGAQFTVRDWPDMEQIRQVFFSDTPPDNLLSKAKQTWWQWWRLLPLLTEDEKGRLDQLARGM